MHIIGGKFKNYKLKSPSSIRPTSAILRKSFFDSCKDFIEASSFLDLFAGTGAMGFEALSRGASKVTFVDNHKDSIKAIIENAKSFKVEKQIEILCIDAEKAIIKLQKQGKKFDIIYIDPPYANADILICKSILESKILADRGHLYMETSTDFVFHDLKIKKQKKFGSSLLTEIDLV